MFIYHDFQVVYDFNKIIEVNMFSEIIANDMKSKFIFFLEFQSSCPIDGATFLWHNRLCKTKLSQIKYITLKEDNK